MTTWKYADQSRRIVISDDGRQSMLAATLPEGTPIAELDPVTPEAARDEFKAIVREYLDAGARSEDYDSIVTAVSYTGSAFAKWRDDSVRFLAWRDAVVSAAYLAEQTIQASGQIPTADEFRAMLPILPKANA
jgi:hypothetical protein